MTNTQKIEMSREVRLWIGQIIGPVAAIAATSIMASPEVRHAIVEGIGKVSNKITEKMKRK